ncbi:Zn-dependent protease (includes SpoIVFB) [Streptomyces sp. cf386]|uniref:site-2 protease family protein n=1 Tax=Streptomyces sp. cf386 TaxID=1761904 RepID=UPI000885DAA0|nr:site-2 protease family protein [Streptomyces sp. cf386]SDO71880.1 Zn-dependent protease (includes SpoIVFB) [Streptomyces sp. cf386]
MDESGSGQPRSGDEESTERHAPPATPATGPTRPGTPRPATGTDKPPTPPADEPTMVVRRLDLSHDDSAETAPEKHTGEEPTAKVESESASGDEAQGEEAQGEQTQGPDADGQEADPADLRDRAADRDETGQDNTVQHDTDHTSPWTKSASPDAHRPLARTGLKGQPPRTPEPRGGLLMGRPFGVPVYVAPSWFLVAALITWVFGGQLDRVLPELGAARYLVSLFFAVAFYASVLVHELAHTVAALRFKLPVRRIQLQFFGGVSEIEKEAETPGREFVLAFVGPLLSLVLAGVFYAALQIVEPGTVPGVLLAGLMISNLIVAAFNLLPGLPLDGGRMLRAVVWKITGKPMHGTIAAAWVGRALAVSVLIGLPLLTQSGALGSDAVDNVGMDTVMDALLAAILAAIIWTGAGNSLRMARLREHLPELRARALTRRAVPVETDTPLSEALRRANAAGARALVVVDADGNPLSLVREAAIVGVPEHRRPWVAVSGLAQDLTDGMRVSAELAGEELLDTLRATPATEYLVVEETGEIYGVLSAADVERAFVKAMARPN